MLKTAGPDRVLLSSGKAGSTSEPRNPINGLGICETKTPALVFYIGGYSTVDKAPAELLRPSPWGPYAWIGGDTLYYYN